MLVQPSMNKTVESKCCAVGAEQWSLPESWYRRKPCLICHPDSEVTIVTRQGLQPGDYLCRLIRGRSFGEAVPKIVHWEAKGV